MRIKKCITGLLIAGLCLFGYQRSKALLPECIIGIIVIGTGVVIYVGLKKMCKAIPPLDNPPSPPPCNTNAPAHRLAFVSVPANIPRINLSDDAIEAYSVSGTVFENKDPYGLDYNRLFRGSIDSSANLSTWSNDCKFVGWMSPRYAIMVFYNDQGTPVLTNGCDLTYGSGTNEVSMPILGGPIRFFRSASW